MTAFVNRPKKQRERIYYRDDFAYKGGRRVSDGAGGALNGAVKDLDGANNVYDNDQQYPCFALLHA